MSRRAKELKGNMTLNTSERSSTVKSNYRYFNSKKPLTPNKNHTLSRKANSRNHNEKRDIAIQQQQNKFKMLQNLQIKTQP